MLDDKSFSEVKLIITFFLFYTLSADSTRCPCAVLYEFYSSECEKALRGDANTARWL